MNAPTVPTTDASLPVLAGIAETTITPPSGVDLAGFACRTKPAEGIYDELKALAVVFDDGKRRAALCVADILDVTAQLVEAVRSRVAARTGIPADRLLIAATHTHSGPSLSSANPLNRVWLPTLEDKLVEVLVAADAGRRAVRIGTAAGAVDGVGGNRRDPKNGPIDRSVTVMRVDDAATGRALAVLVHHACHATTLSGANYLITSDYPGQVRATVAGLLADRPAVLFMNGACGDINPGGYSAEDSALGNFTPGRTFENAARMGRVIGEEAVRLVNAMPMTGAARVHGIRRRIRLPLKPMPTPADADKAVQRAEAQQAEAERTAAPKAVLDRAKLDLLYSKRYAFLARQYHATPTHDLETELQALAVGDTFFLGLPGEVFTEIGQWLKRRQPFAHAFLVGYANDGTGYLPSAEALRDGSGYEVLSSRFGPEAIERFMEEMQRLAVDLHAELQAMSGAERIK